MRSHREVWYDDIYLLLPHQHLSVDIPQHCGEQHQLELDGEQGGQGTHIEKHRCTGQQAT